MSNENHLADGEPKTAESQNNVPGFGEIVPGTLIIHHAAIADRAAQMIDAASDACDTRDVIRVCDSISGLSTCLLAAAQCGPLPQTTAVRAVDPIRAKWKASAVKWQHAKERAVGCAGKFSDGGTHLCTDPAKIGPTTAITPDEWSQIISTVANLVTLIGKFFI